MPYANEFDVVISNAALHWVRDQRGAVASIARALKPGGRLVMEMGGRGNLRHLLEAVYQALRSLGIANPEKLSPWSFPSIGEYAPLLESQGLEVDFAVLFDRATILEGGDRGLKLWLEMFGRFAVEAAAPEQRKEFSQPGRKVCHARAAAQWDVDYRLQTPAHGRGEVVSPVVRAAERRLTAAKLRGARLFRANSSIAIP